MPLPTPSPDAAASAASSPSSPSSPSSSSEGPPTRVTPRATLRSLELGALAGVQRRVRRPGVVAAARLAGRFGDHAAGWLLLGAAGWLLDRRRRREWAGAGAAVLGAHAATVVVKRVLRRQRPQGVGITVHARTPSRLSFPSSHAASSTAAAIAYGRLLGAPAAPAAVAPLMGASRLVLGLHFPTDVAAGTAVGVVAGRMATRAAGTARAAAPRTTARRGGRA